MSEAKLRVRDGVHRLSCHLCKGKKDGPFPRFYAVGTLEHVQEAWQEHIATHAHQRRLEMVERKEVSVETS
jgi:hypothetical protein